MAEGLNNKQDFSVPELHFQEAGTWFYAVDGASRAKVGQGDYASVRPVAPARRLDRAAQRKSYKKLFKKMQKQIYGKDSTHFALPILTTANSSLFQVSRKFSVQTDRATARTASRASKYC